MSTVGSNSGCLNCELVCLVFLQTHRETDRFLADSGVQLPYSTFHFRRLLFSSQMSQVKKLDRSYFCVSNFWKGIHVFPLALVLSILNNIQDKAGLSLGEWWDSCTGEDITIQVMSSTFFFWHFLWSDMNPHPNHKDISLSQIRSILHTYPYYFEDIPR
jgi:hypothetical protein